MVANDDPNRCQFITPTGQCTKEAVEGQSRCPTHGGTPKSALKAYFITNKYLGDSPSRHIAVDEIKSLREEIAITRAFIETRINMVASEAEFVAAMPVVAGYMATIEKLVSSCHAMEVKLGTLLSKSALLTLAQKMIDTITTTLVDIPGRDELVEKIADELVRLIIEQEQQ